MVISKTVASFKSTVPVFYELPEPVDIAREMLLDDHENVYRIVITIPYAKRNEAKDFMRALETRCNSDQGYISNLKLTNGNQSILIKFAYVKRYTVLGIGRMYEIEADLNEVVFEDNSIEIKEIIPNGIKHVSTTSKSNLESSTKR